MAFAAALMGREPPPLIAFEDADLSPMAKSFMVKTSALKTPGSSKSWRSIEYPSYREGLRALFEAQDFKPLRRQSVQSSGRFHAARTGDGRLFIKCKSTLGVVNRSANSKDNCQGTASSCWPCKIHQHSYLNRCLKHEMGAPVFYQCFGDGITLRVIFGRVIYQPFIH